MKKSAIIASLFFVFISSMAYAHPPSDIKITYDQNSKMLKALIMHDVLDTAAHHIKKVDVTQNETQIIEQLISIQDNNMNQTVIYYVPNVKSGDVLGVEAFCSIGGQLKKEIIVK